VYTKRGHRGAARISTLFEHWPFEPICGGGGGRGGSQVSLLAFIEFKVDLDRGDWWVRISDHDQWTCVQTGIANLGDYRPQISDMDKFQDRVAMSDTGLISLFLERCAGLDNSIASIILSF
jgi:hypothetical protein